MEFEAAAAAAPPASSRLPFTEIVCDPNTFEQDIYIDDDDLLDATDQLPPASSAALTANMLQLQQLQQQQQRIGLHHSFHVPSSPPHHRTFPNNTSNHNTSNPQANFRRKLPSHSQSADCFTLGRSSHSNHNRPLQRRGVLKREAQASYGPGGQQQPLPRHSFSQHTMTSGGVSRAGHSHDASMNGLSSFAGTNASNANETSGVMTGATSIPSTHLAVQYMQGMRRLSRSIRQTEMTRSALRRSLRSTPSAQSLPPEMTQVSSYGSGSITENNNGVGVGGMVDPTTTVSSPKNHHGQAVAHHASPHAPQQPHVPVPHCSPSSNTQLLEDDTRHKVLSLAYHQPWTTDNNHGHHHHHAVPEEDVIPEDMLDDDDDDDNDKVQVRQDVPPRGVARITSFHSPVQQAPPQMVEYSMAEVSSPRMAAAPTMNNNGFPVSSPQRGPLLNHHSGPVFGVAATSSSMMQT